MSFYINHIEECLKKTDLYESKITEDILSMEGMSGKKTRHFYNNICSINNIRYLEIGSWKGSSICSAMCNNNITCVCIDNWSEFGGPAEEFIVNFNNYKGNNNARFIESDCWKMDVDSLGKFNIYMYDGAHDEISHYMALKYFYDCLDDEFIYLVDDWNHIPTQNGTIKAINDINFNIIYKKEIFSDNNPGIQRSNNDWHNGICIFVLQKNKNV